MIYQSAAIHPRRRYARLSNIKSARHYGIPAEVLKTEPLETVTHYSEPEKIISTIKNSCSGMKCRMFRGCQMADAFQVQTGLRQGCPMSHFLFILAIDWVLKTFKTQKEMAFSGLLWPCSMMQTLQMIRLSFSIPSNGCWWRPAWLWII